LAWNSNLLGNTLLVTGTAMIIQEREWDRSDAKTEICKILKREPGLGELDIADRLAVDLELACNLCDELVNEGRIERRPIKPPSSKT
jgi:hypothetical protein